MKIQPRDELIIGIVAIVLVVVVLAMVLVRPQLGELSTIATTKQEEESRIRGAQAELELLKAAKSEALQIQADLIKVGNQVPDSPQLPSLVVEIQDLATEAGISFVSIKPGTMTASGEFTTLPIELALHGQFFDVVDFLYRLQHLTREVRVTDLDLKKGSTTQAAGTGGTSGTGTGGQQQQSDGGLDLVVTANVYVMGTVPGAQAPTATPGAPSGAATPAPGGSAPK